MAQESVLTVLFKMASTLSSDGVSMFKSMSGLFRELLSAMGGVFVGGGLSAYVGAAIVLVAGLLAVKFFISESKLILGLIGLILFLFLFAVVF